MSIQINITTGDNLEDKEHFDLDVEGTDFGLIKEAERKALGLDEKKLKDAIYKYCNYRPTEVFVRSPTNFDPKRYNSIFVRLQKDLYGRFNWTQVSRTLEPKNAKIVAISCKPVIVNTQEFINESEKRATFTASTNHSVTEKVSCCWTLGKELETSREMTFNVSVKAFSYSENRTTTPKTTWSQQNEYSKEVTLGSSSGFEVELEPGQAVVVNLVATKGVIDVEVNYSVSLSGTVIGYFWSWWTGHYFHGYNINNLRRCTGLPEKVELKQLLKLEYYTSSRVTVTDKKVLDNRDTNLQHRFVSFLKNNYLYVLFLVLAFVSIFLHVVY